jgi:hypothetical protein
MTAWKFPNVIKKNTQNNEEIGQKIQDLYGEGKGWAARIYRDSLKDDRGILFECNSSVGNAIPIFISFSDAEFSEKAKKVINEKNMKKKGEK